jgi:hypothetical protein
MRVDQSSKSFLDFIYRPSYENSGAQSFHGIAAALRRLGGLSQDVPELQSPFFKSNIKALLGFSNNEATRYFREAICRVGTDVALCAEAPLLNQILYRYVPGGSFWRFPATLHGCALLDLRWFE